MWADNETNEDLLGYQVHADLLKEVVLDSTMLPITIGIFGDWGSGKSSLMLLTKEGIDQWMKEEANKKEKVAQIQFNSWQFENYEDTKLTLIETVLTAIEKDLKKKQGVIKNGVDFLKKIKYLKLGVFFLKKIGQQVVPEELLKLLPTKEEWKKELTDDDAKLLIEEVSKGNATKFIERFREDFEKIVVGADYRSVIVYIDDLDRCEPSRIIQCLEAVKLFVNVKRTAFVIGADERIIEHAIEERYNHKIEKKTISSPYSDYMEKLIQLPYRIPRLSYSEQETYITLLLCSKIEDEIQFKTIHQKFLDFRKKDKHTKYNLTSIRQDNKKLDFGEVEGLLPILPIMTKFLNGNPRQLKRFLNTFDMRMRMAKVAGFEGIKPEVLVKLMVLEYNSVLRENIDDLYSRQKNNGFVGDMADVEKQSKAGRLTSESWTTLWNKPEAMLWLAAPPSLANVNLQDYFWISREALKVETPVENKVSNIVRAAYIRLKKNQTVKAMKSALVGEIRNFTREEKDMMVMLLHQELAEDINSGVITRFLNADENCEMVSSLSLLKMLFEGIETSKLPATYAQFLKRMKGKADCKKYVEDMEKGTSLKNALK